MKITIFQKVHTDLCLFLLCLCILTGCGNQSTPEKTMKNFQESYNQLDWEGMLECFEPSVSQGLKATTELLGDVLDIDVDTLLQMAPMMNTLFSEDMFGEDGKIDLEIESITTNEDIAYAAVVEKSTEMRTTFVLKKIDSIWYISLSPEDYESMDNTMSTATEQDENHVSSQTEISDSTEVVGNPVTFEDSEMQSCIKKHLGISSDDIVTDEMCKSITGIDTSGYVLTTLADLELFPNLTELYVDNSGRELNLKGINKIPNVVSITLRNCQLSEIDRLSDLSSLEYLDLSTDESFGTQINDYSSLANLTNLKHLDLSWTAYNVYNPYDLVDASFINHLSNLEELNIYETGIDNYSLDALSHLKRLTISHCNVDQILQQISSSGSLEILEYLNISGTNTDMTDTGFSLLSMATNLRELNINCSELTTLTGLGNLQNLEILHLDNGSELPLSEYEELSKLKKLTDLSLTSCPIQPAGSDDYAFLNSITSLVTLAIPAYDGMCIDCFTGLDKLETLQIGYHYSSYPDEIDITGIEKFKSLKLFKYGGVKFKSSAPLDDLDDLIVEEIKLSLW